MRLYRTIFSTGIIEKYIPEADLRNLLGQDAVLAINLGSPGPEQKITVIGSHGTKSFFSKYGVTENAKWLINSEYQVLMRLQGNDFVPAVSDHFSNSECSFLKTELFTGKRFSREEPDNDVLSLIREIQSLNIPECNKVNTNLETSFAHGDFCPWNLMIVGKSLKVFDWEMGGYYPMGYDLFTYIFQTNFLLHPKRLPEEIVAKNILHFKASFGDKDWKPFLVSFAEIKLEVEILKGNRRLIPHYKRLREYAKKT